MAGVRRRPQALFTVSALALLTLPVRYTLHLGEVNLIVAALAGGDLLRRRDGGWWQGIATGIAAGIKLTPLIFIAYLAITRRFRAAAVAAAVFTVTVAAAAGARCRTRRRSGHRAPSAWRDLVVRCRP